MLLLSVPFAQGSCHMCLETAVADCSSISVPDCADSAAHLATHMPGYLMEGAGKDADQTCEDLDEPGCP